MPGEIFTYSEVEHALKDLEVHEGPRQALQEIDLSDSATKDWQRENMRLALDGYTLGIGFNTDGTIRWYKAKDGVVSDRAPPPKAA
jgi:hypothetical protein